MAFFDFKPCLPPRDPDSLPELNEDVMEAVCSWIADTRDLISMSLTCSVMWRIAIRQLLRTHTITLKSRRAIRGFREFILNQKPTRAPHIRSLRIPETAWSNISSLDRNVQGPEQRLNRDPQDLVRVLDILDCAVNLETLDLSLAHYWPEFPERVAAAIARMGALRDLVLVDPAAIWAPHALRAVRSPLLGLCVRGMVLSSASPTNPSNGLLSRFSSTLTSLHIGNIPMHPDAFLQLPPFRSVRSLTLTDVRYDLRVDALLHLFPSLDGTLRIRTYRPGASLLLVSSRSENRHAQAVTRWARLDKLDCDATTAYKLGLQCPVRHLTMDRLDLEVFPDIKPKHLVIAPIEYPLDLIGLIYNSSTFVLSHHLRSITHAVLVVTYCTFADVNDRLGSFADRPWAGKSLVEHAFVVGLSMFPCATHMRLVVLCAENQETSEGADEFISQMRDAVTFASGVIPPILVACPKLQYFFLATAGREKIGGAQWRRWFCSRGWRIVARKADERDGCLTNVKAEPSGRTFEDVDDDAARRVMDKEDLGLPEEWEQRLELYRM